ncbi:hypothetical protein [Roseburia sp. AM59-24XD]|uniref:hypothetical protein n=1 Tax=Roseburia sp. AM59-24XD TaxID=2293138 RepID=UPI0011C3F521|nr:hypothetical protein [Roseburia sp. AM59-24XD]
MFREALAPAGTYAPDFVNATDNLFNIRRYVPLRGAVVAGACRPKQLSPPMGLSRTDAYLSKHCKAKIFQKSY